MESVTYRFDGFEIDPAYRVFSWRGDAVASPIQIPARAFDLLLYMVRNPQRLLTKEELMDAIWGAVIVEDGNLTQSIFLLRKALAGTRPENGIVVTVPGRGYRFDVPVLVIPFVEQAGGTARPTAGPRRIRMAVAAGLAVVGLAAAGWFWYTRVVPGDHHEIVLADFENTTGDPGFDKALNVALSIDLKQSPFLLITPDKQARRPSN